MKKYFALFLAALMLLSLAAGCALTGSDTPADPDATPAPSTTDGTDAEANLDLTAVVAEVGDEAVTLGDVKELFTRFHQGAKESTGTGLGLAYSKVLLEQHKGSIGAYNNEDKGATFYFPLPLHQAAGSIAASVSDSLLVKKTSSQPVPAPATHSAQPPLQPEEEKEVPLQPAPAAKGPDPSSRVYTLLVVDDQEDITQFLSESLKHDFKEILIAKNGVEALKVIRSNRPDAVISDVMMPRMDGYELCRKIKNDIAISHIPVVLLTAKTDEQSILTGYKTGADAYLPKPFDLEVVKQIVFNAPARSGEVCVTGQYTLAARGDHQLCRRIFPDQVEQVHRTAHRQSRAGHFAHREGNVHEPCLTVQ